MSLPKWWHSQDVGNIVVLEHVNLELPNDHLARLFFVDGIGCSVDPFRRGPSPYIVWYNLGFQQFHIRISEGKPANIVDGEIGLIVPNLEECVARLTYASQFLKGTKFSFEVVKYSENFKPLPVDDISEYITVTCPWGNNYHIYENTPSIKYRANAGLPYVLFRCPPNTAQNLAEFYENYMGAPSNIEKVDGRTFVRVCVGPRQQIIFEEKVEDDRSVEVKQEGGGYHIAIYVANFSRVYEALSREKVIGEEKYSDKYATFEMALKASQLRFEKIIYKGTPVMILEQEVRSMYHIQYMRTLVNRIGTEGIYCNQ